MHPAAPIPVLIVHRNPFAGACIESALRAHPGLAVRDALHEVPEDIVPPSAGGSVMVTDHRSGLEIAGRLPRTAAGATAGLIVVVGDADREWELRQALGRKVRGYLSPGFTMDQLVESVVAVHRGARYLCPRTAARLAESLSVDPLTEREQEVLELVTRGLCNKLIGKQLRISLGTVKSHLKSTYSKLEVMSRTQAIMVADRRGLLDRRGDAPQRCVLPQPGAYSGG